MDSFFYYKQAGIQARDVRSISTFEVNEGKNGITVRLNCPNEGVFNQLYYLLQQTNQTQLDCSFSARKDNILIFADLDEREKLARVVLRIQQLGLMGGCDIFNPPPPPPPPPSSSPAA